MSTDPGKNEFRIAKCMACKVDIRLPVNIKPTAKIQCPVCKEKFSLADLDGPPVATVIDDDEEEDDVHAKAVQVNVPHVDRIVSESEGKDVWNAMSVPSYNKTTARGRDKSHSHSHSHSAPVINQETVEAHPARPHSQRKSERKRKEKIKGNKKKDLYKVIAGALIALPVFQLILWWVVKQDPLSLAPTVGKYAPFVVPAKLRPQESIEVVDDNEDIGDPDAPGNMRVKTNR